MSTRRYVINAHTEATRSIPFDEDADKKNGLHDGLGMYFFNDPVPHVKLILVRDGIYEHTINRAMEDFDGTLINTDDIDDTYVLSDSEREFVSDNTCHVDEYFKYLDVLERWNSGGKDDGSIDYEDYENACIELDQVFNVSIESTH